MWVISFPNFLNFSRFLVPFHTEEAVLAAEMLLCNRLDPRRATASRSDFDKWLSSESEPSLPIVDESESSRPIISAVFYAVDDTDEMGIDDIQLCVSWLIDWLIDWYFQSHFPDADISAVLHYLRVEGWILRVGVQNTAYVAARNARLWLIHSWVFEIF